MFKRLDPFVIDGLRVQVLGDTHLGRRFKTGVPLHRLGDRERMIAEDFKNNFRDLQDVDFHVHMGDIFDKPVVSPEIIALAADIYATASKAYPRTRFILLRGNHDATKDLEGVTSFDILARILRHHNNVEVVDEIPLHYGNMLSFYPWNPIVSAQEMTEQLIKHPTTAAFGHWDVVNPQSDHNLIPEVECQFYVTGHDHVRRMETAHGKPVHVVGSMQPFTHGEDPTQVLYKTLTVKELSSIDTTNLCVRVRLEAGEDMPEIDALQVTTLRVNVEADELEQVSLDGLDMNATMAELMSAEGVSPELQAIIMEKYRA